jgi:hypothetical protein
MERKSSFLRYRKSPPFHFFCTPACRLDYFRVMPVIRAESPRHKPTNQNVVWLWNAGETAAPMLLVSQSAGGFGEATGGNRMVRTYGLTHINLVVGDVERSSRF